MNLVYFNWVFLRNSFWSCVLFWTFADGLGGSGLSKGPSKGPVCSNGRPEKVKEFIEMIKVPTAWMTIWMTKRQAISTDAFQAYFRFWGLWNDTKAFCLLMVNISVLVFVPSSQDQTKIFSRQKILQFSICWKTNKRFLSLLFMDPFNGDRWSGSVTKKRIKRREKKTCCTPKYSCRWLHCNNRTSW